VFFKGQGHLNHMDFLIKRKTLHSAISRLRLYSVANGLRDAEIVPDEVKSLPRISIVAARADIAGIEMRDALNKLR